jgi:hypothetical protein
VCTLSATVSTRFRHYLEKVEERTAPLSLTELRLVTIGNQATIAPAYASTRTTRLRITQILDSIPLPEALYGFVLRFTGVIVPVSLTTHGMNVLPVPDPEKLRSLRRVQVPRPISSMNTDGRLTSTTEIGPARLRPRTHTTGLAFLNLQILSAILNGFFCLHVILGP